MNRNIMQAEEYDKVRVESKGVDFEGTLMPSQTENIVLKLKNGYNIGIKRDTATIDLLEKKEEKKIVILFYQKNFVMQVIK